jgi:hypothetical protein
MLAEIVNTLFVTYVFSTSTPPLLLFGAVNNYIGSGSSSSHRNTKNFVSKKKWSCRAAAAFPEDCDDEGDSQNGAEEEDDNDNTNNVRGNTKKKTRRRQRRQRHELVRWIALTVSVLLINLIGNNTTAAAFFVGLLQPDTRVKLAFRSIPKVLYAAIAYLVALYWDCRCCWRRRKTTRQQQRQQQQQQCLRFDLRTEFLPRVMRALVRIVPLYPILAILISFGFLVLIDVLEAFRLPTTALLNWPIYYGTLYGPFSYIYITVKRDVVAAAAAAGGGGGGYLLPTTALQAGGGDARVGVVVLGGTSRWLGRS